MTYRFDSRFRLGLLAVSILALGACSDDGSDDISLADEFGDDDEADSGVEGTGDELGDEGEGTSGAGDDGGAGEGGGEGGDETGGEIEPGQLTAGEWRDLDNWSFWRGLFAQGSDWAQYDLFWGFDTSVRIPVMVVAADDPIADVGVTLRDAQDAVVWQARTDNLGRAEMWPGLFGAEIAAPLTLEAGGVELEIASLPDELVSDPYVLQLDAAPAEPNNLDLMFVIDTTGSMGDELEYLQSELEDVISRVSQELGGLDLRIGMSFYKDHGDVYVVESYPFTTDVGEAIGQLNAHSADGGGDFPEAVVEALDDAVFEHEWSSSARARLMFLVLDAPPHDTTSNRASMAESVQEAAEQGIRIVPLAASGIDKPTEFLLRDFDIATGGTYTFLTGHSGIGGEHLEPTVGEYEVELLNDLLVRLIVEAME
jgi:hypothetical protein